jgi:putative DNA primase/helicase
MAGPLLGGDVTRESTDCASPLNSTAAPSDSSAVISRLAALGPLDYDKARRAEAKALGVQVKTLDEMVKSGQRGGSSNSRVPFVDHEPAPDPVDPPQMLSEIAALIRSLIVLEVEQADAAALWVAHTYLADVSDVSPLAIINAPERACAKTLFQTVLGRLVYRPLFAANATLSALFRGIEAWQPTILIDEADTFLHHNAEMHGVINAGYKKGGFVLRSEATGDSFEPKIFQVYGPKSIAGIALERHLPDSTMSRGLLFNMRRKASHENVQRLRFVQPGRFERLASQIARFAVDYAHQIQNARPVLPEELGDRAQDNWEPLFAIAMCAGDEWVERANRAARAMAPASEVLASTGNDLLADIREVLSRWSSQTIKTTDLIDRLTADEDMGWVTYNRGKPLTPRQLAKLLSAYQIKPKTVRQPKSTHSPTGSTPKGYDVADFEDAFRRYLKDSAEVVVIVDAKHTHLKSLDSLLPDFREVTATAQQDPSSENSNTDF